MQKIKIIHEPSKTEPYIVLKKDALIPSAPLYENDTENALFYAAKLFPEVKSVIGKKQIEYGLLHRLDTTTEGLLLIATTQDFYDYMKNEQENNRFIKKYAAVCTPFKENAELLKGFPKANCVIPPTKTTEISSFFRNFGPKNKEVRPVTENSNISATKKAFSKTKYTTNIEKLLFNKNEVYSLCSITKGYRHQVRCHLAWYGLPVKGDILYNYNEKQNPSNNNLSFYAIQIEFINKEDNKRKVYRMEKLPERGLEPLCPCEH